MMVFAAAVGMLGESSCKSMKSLGHTITEMGLNPFEKTYSMNAVVVHAATPSYHAGGEHIMGKGKGEITTQEGYSQSIVIRTSDGQTYKGSISVDSIDACVSTGDEGVAEIGVTSHMLKHFEKSY